MFYGNDRAPKVKPEHFVQWGKIGFVANKGTHTAKMKACGTPMMFVAYALNHPSDTYEFFNPVTNSIVISNSVKWKHFNRWEATRMDTAMGNLLESKVPEDDDSVSEDDDILQDTIPSPPLPSTTSDTTIPESPDPPHRITRSLTRAMQDTPRPAIPSPQHTNKKV